MTTSSGNGNGNVMSVLLQWITPILVGLLAFFAQVQYADIRTELKELKAYASDMKAGYAVQVREIQYLQKKLEDHERWLEDLEKVNRGRNR